MRCLEADISRSGLLLVHTFIRHLLSICYAGASAAIAVSPLVFQVPFCATWPSVSTRSSGSKWGWLELWPPTQLPLWLRNTHPAVGGVKSPRRVTLISTFSMSQLLPWPSGVPLSRCDSRNLAQPWESVFLLYQRSWSHLV